MNSSTDPSVPVNTEPFSRLRKLRGRTEEAKRRYENGETVTALARDFGVSSISVCRLLEKMGVPRRNSSEAQKGTCRHRRILSVNESAFDVLTPESAYWIGFLMADGCVSQKPQGQKCLTLTLADRDREHVAAFKNFLGSDHKLMVNKQGQTSFSVVSDRLCAALSAYGLVPRKSLTAEVIGLENNRDFWRGMIDGDGCLSFHSGRGHRPYPRLHLVGSLAIVRQFAGFVRSLCPTCAAQPMPSNNAWQIQIAGVFAKKIATVLYEDAAMALSRKADIASQFMAWERKNRDLSSLAMADLLLLHQQFGYWSKVASALGISLSSLKYVRRRLRRD